MSSDERLLPTVTTLRGNEVLRIMAADGKRMLLPVEALLVMAEQRFPTRSREDAQLKACWDAIYAATDRVMTLEQAVHDLPAPDPNYTKALDALVARLASEVLPRLDDLARRLGEVEKRPVPVAVDLTPLTARVVALEARPVVSTVGLATQSSVNTIASQQSIADAAIGTLRTDLLHLTDRVSTLEASAKPKLK